MLHRVTARSFRRRSWPDLSGSVWARLPPTPLPRRHRCPVGSAMPCAVHVADNQRRSDVRCRVRLSHTDSVPSASEHTLNRVASPVPSTSLNVEVEERANRWRHAPLSSARLCPAVTSTPEAAGRLSPSRGNGLAGVGQHKHVFEVQCHRLGLRLALKPHGVHAADRSRRCPRSHGQGRRQRRHPDHSGEPAARGPYRSLLANAEGSPVRVRDVGLKKPRKSRVLYTVTCAQTTYDTARCQPRTCVTRDRPAATPDSERYDPQGARSALGTAISKLRLGGYVKGSKIAGEVFCPSGD